MTLARFVPAVAIALAAAIAPAAAQSDAANFPNRAIRIIVPFPPGGPTDIIARFVGQRMSERWSQPVVIEENRAGANTAIGAQIVAKSAPDGLTLLAGMDTTMVLNPILTANLPYDAARDFAPVTLLAKNMSLMVLRSDGPATVKELIARAKANPGKLNMGAGTITSRLGSPRWRASRCNSSPTRAAPRSCRVSCPAASISRSTASDRACR